MLVKNSAENATPRGCNGNFVFNRAGEIPDERTCELCRRKETYELGIYVLVGRPSVTSRRIKNFCKYAKLKIIEIKQDRSNPLILAAVVSWDETEPHDLMLEELIAHRPKVIWAVLRKPVAFDEEKNRIEYIKRGRS